MGYRPHITDGTTEYCGTKLYGYVKDEKNLESYIYLCSIGKFKGNELFIGYEPNEITLTAEEFRIFINLYEHDYFVRWGKPNPYVFPHHITQEKDIQKLMESKENKTIYWN